MGIKEGGYPKFKEFNRCAVKEPIAEINRISDFQVIVDYQREHRRVTALKFKMRRVASLSEPNKKQGKLFPDLDDIPLVVKELKEAGMSSQDAWEIWQQSFSYVDKKVRLADFGDDTEAAFVQYIREKIHLLKRRQASGKVENSTGFLLQAIRQNYANPEFVQEQQCKTASEAKQRAQKEQERQVKALERQRADIESACGKALDQLFGQVAAEAPGVINQAASELLAENEGFRFLYDRCKSALENYQARIAIQPFFHPYLERHVPARFETLKQHYAAQLDAVDEQISAFRSSRP